MMSMKQVLVRERERQKREKDDKNTQRNQVVPKKIADPSAKPVIVRLPVAAVGTEPGKAECTTNDCHIPESQTWKRETA